jgi:hypothetical protein
MWILFDNVPVATKKNEITVVNFKVATALYLTFFPSLPFSIQIIKNFRVPKLKFNPNNSHIYIKRVLCVDFIMKFLQYENYNCMENTVEL